VWCASPEVKEKGGLPTALSILASNNSEHLDAFYVDGIAFYVAGDGYVMAFMSLKGVAVFDGQDFVIAVGDHNRTGAGFEAFLGASSGGGIGALGAAFGIADPAIYGLGFAHVIGCDNGYHQKQN